MSTVAATASTTTTTTAAPSAVQRPASEPQALAAFTSAGPSTVDRCLEVIKQAARTREVAPETLEGALSLLEQLQQKQDGAAATPPPPASSVVGSTWWLIFSTATSQRAFQYIPVRELFRVGKDRVALDSRIGPFRFVISGPRPAGQGYDAATGALPFSFNVIEAFWSPWNGDEEIPPVAKPLWRKDIASPKAKSYTFYFAEGMSGGAGVGGVAAARSSAGGLALLVRVP